MQKLTPTPQTGALALVSLTKNYKPQMVALLLRNGIIANNNMSEKQLASLMASVLKVSPAYKKDLSTFVSNPKVAQKVAGGFMNFTEEAKFFNVTGFADFTDFTVPFCDRPENANLAMCKDDPLMTATTTTASPASSSTTTAPSSTTNTANSPSFWSGLLSQVPNYLNQGLGLLGSMDKNKTDREIADAQAKIAMYQAQGLTINPETGLPLANPKSTGMSTTTIVVLSLVGVGLLGTVIYLVARK